MDKYRINIDRQIDRQTKSRREKHAYSSTRIQTDGKIDRQTDCQAVVEKNRRADEQTERWKDEQKHRWADRQMYRQINGQTDRGKDRQACRKRMDRQTDEEID